MKKVIYILIFMALGLGGLSATAQAQKEATSFPFQPGEKLTYKLHWGLVTAGYAELEVLPFEQINGKKAWHFLLTARSSTFIDVFYKVRDRIESFTDEMVANSFLYIKEQREGTTDRDVVVNFNRENNTVSYSDKGEGLAPVKIVEGTIDPLASLYFIRNYALDDQVVIVRPITDGKRNVKGSAKVIGREKLFVDGTEYDTFVVEPDLGGVSGVFEKSKKSKIQLWITADERRLLVKMKSKVVVGSFTATMVDASFSEVDPVETR